MSNLLGNVQVIYEVICNKSQHFSGGVFGHESQQEYTIRRAYSYPVNALEVALYFL